MTTFSAMDIARTGVGFANRWMDTVSHNIANLNTDTNPADEPFRARKVIAAALGDAPFARTGSGVAMGDVRETDAVAPLRHDPDNPLADEDGMVQGAAVDMAGEMTDLMLANRSYQANLRTVESAREAYKSALRLGQG